MVPGPLAPVIISQRSIVLSDRRIPSLAEIPHRIRQQLRDLPGRWRTLREDIRQDPSRFWQSPLVRVPAYVLLGAVLLVSLSYGIRALTPGGTLAVHERPTATATLYVACTNPECRATYRTQQLMDFDDWPLECEKCGQKTVYRAQRCRECRRWFANVPGEKSTCPHCASRKAAQQRVEPLSRPSPTGDDIEDPW